MSQSTGFQLARIPKVSLSAGFQKVSQSAAKHTTNASLLMINLKNLFSILLILWLQLLLRIIVIYSISIFSNNSPKQVYLVRVPNILWITKIWIIFNVWFAWNYNHLFISEVFLFEHLRYFFHWFITHQKFTLNTHLLLIFNTHYQFKIINFINCITHFNVFIWPSLKSIVWVLLSRKS